MSGNPVYRFQINDVVIVNPGIDDPDYGNDISGWRGKVISVEDDDDDDNGQLLTILWDNETLKKMDRSVIADCEENGINWQIMDLYADDVSVVKQDEKSVKTVFSNNYFNNLTCDKIMKLADSRVIFGRGEEYLSSGAVHNFKVAGNCISAKVYGEYGRYSVNITDENYRLNMKCNCPYDGDVCKHLVAVMLCYLAADKTEEKEEKEVLLPDVISQSLSSMPHHELVEILVDLMNKNENFRHLLLSRITISPQLISGQSRSPEQVSAIKQQIDEFFDILDHRDKYGGFDFDDDYYDRDYFDDDDYDDDEFDELPDLKPVFEIVNTLHPHDQMEISWYLLACGNKDNVEIAYCLSDVVNAIGIYAKAARMISNTKNEKNAVQKILIDILEWNYGNCYEVEDIVRESIEMFCDNEDDTRKMIDLLRKANEKKFADWIAEYYLKLGDDIAYLAIRQANLHMEEQFLDLAEYWIKHEKHDIARNVLEQYVDKINEEIKKENEHNYQMKSGGVFNLLESYYRKSGDDINLCRVLLIRYLYCGFNIEQYKQIKIVSQSAGNWSETRTKLHNKVWDNRVMMLQVYLADEEWDLALKLKERNGYYSSYSENNLNFQIANGVKKYRPKEAINILENLVQYEIDRKDRDAYARAVKYADEIRDIYLNVLKKESTWKSYITKLRQNYSRRTALQDEFRDLWIKEVKQGTIL